MKRHMGRYKRINKDLMRLMLDDSVYDIKNENFILDIREYAVIKALLNGYDIIIDDNNFNDKHWYQMCDIAKRVGDVRVVEKYFEVSLKEALIRNTERENKVSDHVIEDAYKRFIKHKKIDIRDEYFPHIKKEFSEDINKKDCIIVDIDVCLVLRDPYNWMASYLKHGEWIMSMGEEFIQINLLPCGRV